MRRIHATNSVRVRLPYAVKIPANVLPFEVFVLGQRWLLSIDHASLSKCRVERHVRLCQQNLVWVYHVLLLDSSIPSPNIVEEILKLLVSNKASGLSLVFIWNDLVHELLVVALLVLALIQVRPQRGNVSLMHLQLLLTQGWRLTLLPLRM